MSTDPVMELEWEVHEHTMEGAPGHPLYSITTNSKTTDYWLIAAPLTFEVAQHIVDSHNLYLYSKEMARREQEGRNPDLPRPPGLW